MLMTSKNTWERAFVVPETYKRWPLFGNHIDPRVGEENKISIKEGQVKVIWWSLKSKMFFCLEQSEWSALLLTLLCTPIIQVDRPTWILSNSWEHDGSCLNLTFYIVIRYIISKVLEFKLKYNYWFEFKHDSSCSQEHEKIQIHSMHINCLKTFSLFIKESSSACVD